MKKTPLYEEHKKLSARIVEFAGWLMPVFYTNVIDEHITTRTKAGLFDISHMGEIEVIGKHAFVFLQEIITRDLKNLPENKAFYTVMLNEKGGIIDDLFVYCFNREKYLLVINAARTGIDFMWLVKHKKDFEIDIINKTEQIAKLDMQGPKAEEILQKLTNANLKELKRFYFIEADEIIISRTGYTAEDGFELYFNVDKAVEMWNRLLEAGKEFGIKAVGLGARDTLRIEACYSLYGHEISEEINPFEAGLDFVVKLDKDFIGKKALDKPMRRIAVFEMIDRAIPRQGYEIIENNEKIGIVTSGTMSPTLKKGIGLGLVDIKHISLGNEIHIKIREKLYKAKIVERPFYKYKGGIK